MLKKTQSVESWEMPWTGKWKRNRTLVVPQSQSGRNVDETCFLLCFVSVFLLSSSLILIGLSTWSLIRKIPYYSLVDIRTDTSYFTLPAAILGIPTCWVAASIHNKANDSRFTLLLVFLITLSIILLVVGSIVGFTYSSQIDNSTSRVVYNIENALLNQSLWSSFLYINTSAAHMNPWHKAQWQLKCCGITSYKDWLDNGMQIPSSCCSNLNPSQYKYTNTTYAFDTDTLEFGYIVSMVIFNSRNFVIGLQEGIKTITIDPSPLFPEGIIYDDMQLRKSFSKRMLECLEQRSGMAQELFEIPCLYDDTDTGYGDFVDRAMLKISFSFIFQLILMILAVIAYFLNSKKK